MRQLQYYSMVCTAIHTLMVCTVVQCRCNPRLGSSDMPMEERKSDLPCPGKQSK